MADTKKSFTEDWATNTITGRVVDAVTGGAVSRAAKKAGRKPPTVNRAGKGDKQVGLSDMRETYKDRFK